MIFDAHVHFDCRKKAPFDDLVDGMIKSKIDNCILIINTEQEKEVLLNHIKRIKKNKIFAAIALLLDGNESVNFFNEFTECEIPIIAKLHPRLSNITKRDFEKIKTLINDVNTDKIIVDSFIYGPCIENHIGTELAIFLAQIFQDKEIIIAHAGGCAMLSTLLMTRPIPNIFYDLSLSCNYLADTSVRRDMVHSLRFWTDRIMFGTDYPDFDFRKAKEIMLQLCKEAQLCNEQMEAIFWKNARRIYLGE